MKKRSGRPVRLASVAGALVGVLATTAGAQTSRSPPTPPAAQAGQPTSAEAQKNAARQAVLERMIHHDEQALRDRRRQTIQLLEEFLHRYPRGPEVPEALFRLAELQWQRAQAEYVETYARWEQQQEAHRRAGEPTASERSAPQVDLSVPQALYRRILDEYPSFDRVDFVLYLYGFGLTQQGRDAEGLEAYRRLLREHRDSRFVPDAHMALAEQAFNSRFDYATALPEYEAVLRFPDSDLYAIALFKSAWCLWRLERPHEAQIRFKQVLDLTAEGRPLTGAQRRRLQELQEEALTYLVQVFTEDERNSADDMLRFLTELGGPAYAHQVMRRLAETFFDQARFEKAVDAYRLLIRLEPLAAEAPDFQNQIVQAYSSLGDPDNQVREMVRLVTEYGPGSSWAQSQRDRRVAQRAAEMAEQSLRRHAMVLHETAQSDNSNRIFQRASDAYQLYLRHFPHGGHAYEARFFAAEINFHRLQRYEDAGTLYLDAAREDPHGRFTRDALYNAIDAFERVREAGLRTAPRGQRPAGAPPAEAVAETPADRKFAEAIELYVSLYPNDPEMPQILFRHGRLYYDYGAYDPAVRLFGIVLERYPQSPFAQSAGEMILDCFNRARDFGNIETWARRLLRAPAFRSPQNQQRLRTLVLQAIFRRGEEQARGNEHARAAETYTRAADEFPQDARASQALFNAGTEWQRGGNPDAAGRVFNRIVQDYRTAPEASGAAWTAAQLYEAIAQFDDAARFYEAFADSFRHDGKAPDALFNATVLRLTLGHLDRAIANGRAYIRDFPNGSDLDEAYFMIGVAYGRMERWQDGARTLREYIDRSHNVDRKIEALERMGEVLQRLGQARPAEQAFEEAVALGRRSAGQLRRGLYYAAQARYQQGETVLHQYEAVRIEGDVRSLRQRLQRKSDLLSRAAEIYTDAVSFHDPATATAALYRIGYSYEQFAQSLRNAPVPPELNEQDQQAYREQLETFVVPIEERALTAYESGYRRALELHIYNRWTQDIRRALERLNDSLYPPLREIGAEVQLGDTLPRLDPIEEIHR